MTLDESLKLERYKLVTERQKYFTELASNSFTAYTKTFAAFAAGGFALVTLKKQLALEPSMVSSLLNAIGILLTFAAVIAIAQIAFCLVRWYEFRNAEREINPSCPKPEWWACAFEGLYCVGILVSVGVGWFGVCHFQSMVNHPL